MSPGDRSSTEAIARRESPVHRPAVALCLLAACGLAALAQPSVEGDAGPVVIGRIDGEIGLAQSAYVKRLVERAGSDGAAALALELNTFGGRLDAAVAIRDLLLDAEVDTVVFINKRAISAGALISLACDRIAISPGGTIGAATPVMSGPGQEMPQAVEEKYLSYFRQEMRVTAEATGRDGDIAAAMVDPDIEIAGLSAAGKLLTLTTSEALEHGIAEASASSLDEALGALGYAAGGSEIKPSWSESLAAFLTSQAVSSILFMGMLVLGYLELQSPGFGVMGAGAAICFLLLYFGHYLVNLAGWEEVLLLAFGVGLLLVELVVIPGFGFIGVVGLLAILGSAVLMLMAGDWSDISFSNPFSLEAFFRVLVTTAVAMGTITLLMRYAPGLRRTRLGSRLVLTEGLRKEAGYTSHGQAHEDLVGQRGVTKTALRPSGKAVIDGQRLNVETEGGYVDAERTVEVIRIDEGRLVVRDVGGA